MESIRQGNKIDSHCILTRFMLYNHLQDGAQQNNWFMLYKIDRINYNGIDLARQWSRIVHCITRFTYYRIGFETIGNNTIDSCDTIKRSRYNGNESVRPWNWLQWDNGIDSYCMTLKYSRTVEPAFETIGNRLRNDWHQSNIERKKKKKKDKCKKWFEGHCKHRKKEALITIKCVDSETKNLSKKLFLFVFNLWRGGPEM